MKSLLDLFDRHPVITGTIGTVSAFLGAILDWVIAHPGELEQWLKILGAAIGVLVGLVTLAIQLLQLRDRRRAVRAAEAFAIRRDGEGDDTLDGVQ